MPSQMLKGSGGGRYGVATVRLSATEVVMQDPDTAERFTFPLYKGVAPKFVRADVAKLVKAKEAGLLVFPAREGRDERVTVVYPGFFSYAMDSRARVLYSLSPAEGAHKCTFVGFARKDPTLPPLPELQRNTFDPSAEPRRIFAANFETSPNDSTPGLQVRWGFWPYKFGPTVNERNQPVMGMERLGKKAGATWKASYEVYRAAGILGRGASGDEEVIMDIPGESDNYLPAVEQVLLDRLSGVEFVINFSTRKDDTGRTRVVFEGLYPAMQEKPKKSKKK